jgi:uncharacterized membrane protein
MDFADLVELIGKSVDIAGVGIIIIGIVVTTLNFVVRGTRGGRFGDFYSDYRKGIGRALLLGLELLVAADIIRTVAISPTIQSVAVLAMIVVIRTFLSWSLEVELNGRWPWQHPAAPDVNP